MNTRSMYLSILALFGSIFASEDSSNKNLKHYSLSYTLQAKDSKDQDDFNNEVKKLTNIFDEARRSSLNGASLYDKLLIFIKEAQEAIVAGINLFNTATVSTNDVLNEVNDAAENIKNETENTKALSPSIKIGLTVTCEDLEKEEAFNALVEKMNQLAQAINNNSNSAQEMVDMLNAIILESKDSGLVGNISINITA